MPELSQNPDGWMEDNPKEEKGKESKSGVEDGQGEVREVNGMANDLEGGGRRRGSRPHQPTVKEGAFACVINAALVMRFEASNANSSSSP